MNVRHTTQNAVIPQTLPKCGSLSKTFSPVISHLEQNAKEQHLNVS